MHVIIIGAGLLGTTTAYFLAESGHQVTVLDRAEAVASETSFANGGILHASYAAPWNGPGLPGQVLRWLGRRDAPLVADLTEAGVPVIAHLGLLPQTVDPAAGYPGQRAAS